MNKLAIISLNIVCAVFVFTALKAIADINNGNIQTAIEQLVNPKPCHVTQASLDAEYVALNTYEIQVEEFCNP